MLTLVKSVAWIALAVVLSGFAWSRTRFTMAPPAPLAEDSSMESTVSRLDETFRAHWHSATTEPTPRANDLTLARRAALALVGAIPSLEEIRWYEAQPRETRLTAYVDRLLSDPRFSHNLAGRLMDAWLPPKDAENFIQDRRARYHRWLVDQIESQRPCDEIVREMLTADGLWTTSPAVMFITASEADPVRLAGSASRAFLGISMDCAECHDHPFAPWKQSQFRGLAAFFGRTQSGMAGVTDGGPVHRFTTDNDPKGEYVLPSVPCDPPIDESDEDLRNRLADWITSPGNPRFSRATANRMWQMIFGKGLIEPVYDLGDAPAVEGVLDILAEDFRNNGHDLRRLLKVILATEAFARTSDLEQAANEEQTDVFAAFPVTRLPANDLARSILQMSSLRTLNGKTNILWQAKDFFERLDFLQSFQSDTEDTAGTVSQRLMLMNGPLVRARTNADWTLTAGRLEQWAPTDQTRVETAFLICLTRRPTNEEQEYFVLQFEEAKPGNRGKVLEDLLWVLVNSTQFQSLW